MIRGGDPLGYIEVSVCATDQIVIADQVPLITEAATKSQSTRPWASAVVNVCFGSKADIQRHTRLSPLSGAKQTSNVRFFGPEHSGGDDVRFRG